MKQKSLAIVLLPLLLTSCARVNAPKEITDYLHACHLETAKEEVKTIHYTLESTISQDEKELGKSTITILYDNTDPDDFYKYRLETYEGNNVILDTTSNLYLTRKEVNLYYHSEDNMYYKETKEYGYQDSTLTGELRTYTPTTEKYYTTSIQDEINSVFATENSAGSNQGGLYYADFFDSRLSYYPYMSIQDNYFYYKLENYPYKNSSEEGLINETIKMDSLGMLVSIRQTAINGTNHKTSALVGDAFYNTQIERKSSRVDSQVST